MQNTYIRRPLGVIRRVGALFVLFSPPVVLPMGLQKPRLASTPPVPKVTQMAQALWSRPAGAHQRVKGCHGDPKLHSKAFLGEGFYHFII